MTWWLVATVAAAAVFGLGWLVPLVRIVATRNRHPRHRKGRHDDE